MKITIYENGVLRFISFFSFEVFLSGGNVPAESYNFFINILLDTVRNEIAACIEKAYERLALNEASRMLFFTNKDEMSEYAKKV